jgi:hypothetical protein
VTVAGSLAVGINYMPHSSGNVAGMNAYNNIGSGLKIINSGGAANSVGTAATGPMAGVVP